MDNSQEQTKRGPGRPPNSTNVMTRKAREQAAASGLLPHEILLDMARGNPQKVRKLVEVGKDADGFTLFKEEEQWVSLSVDEQRDAAKAAAPYYAPKLSSVETLPGMSDDDINSLLESLAAQAGFSFGTGGESQTDATPATPRRHLDL